MLFNRAGKRGGKFERVDEIKTHNTPSLRCQAHLASAQSYHKSKNAKRAFQPIPLLRRLKDIVAKMTNMNLEIKTASAQHAV